MNEPNQGKDPKNGRFLPGNRLGRGRPYRSVGLIRTYGDAIARACPPEVLYQIVAKAVRDALSDNRHCDGARLFLLKMLGADQIRIYLNNNQASPPPTYNLNALSNAELVLLDQLSSKMTIERGS